MSVAKMEKVAIIARKEFKNKIVKAIQEIQKVEIAEFIVKDEDDEKLLSYYIKEDDSIKVKMYKETANEIAQVISVINNYSHVKKTIDDLRKGRQVLTMIELENLSKSYDHEKTINEIKALEKKHSEIKNHKQNLSDREDLLMKWQNLEVSPEEVSKLKNVESTIGIVSEKAFEELAKDIESLSRVNLEKVYEDSLNKYVSLVYLKEDVEDVDIILRKHSFERVSYKFKSNPKDEYLLTKKEIERLVKEEAELIDTFKNYNKDVNSLKLVEEALLTKINRMEGAKEFLHSEYTFSLTGWIEAEKKELLISTIDEKVGKGEYFHIFTTPTEEEFEEVPILLKNKKIVEPFETVTEMYSLPKYDEIDPTPFLVPFHMMFFGMMVADTGYGLVLLIGTFILLKKFNLDKGFKKQIQFFYILSFPVIVWGLIYGSFFGFPLPFALLDTNSNINEILLLSMAVGFVHIFVGLLISGKNALNHKDYFGAVGDSLSWQFILIGLLLIVIDKLVLKTGFIFTLGVVFAIAGAAAVVVVPVITSKSKGGGVAAGLYNLYGLTGYIGDLVSYTRLMALGISGGSIAVAFNMIIGYLPPVARFTVGAVLLIALHVVNIFLSYLGAYVHGMRLQYVEFFGKFYGGGGRAFSPLKAEEKYIYIKEKEIK